MRSDGTAQTHLMTTTIRHWLPLITFCPVNNLPDLIYVTLDFEEFAELYEIRKEVRELVMWKKMFMEDIAKMLAEKFPAARSVQVRLAFDRHLVQIDRYY